MAKNITKRGQTIRDYILRNVEDHSVNIGKLIQKKFKVSRQSASKYLNELISEGFLTGKGNTRARKYRLRELEDHTLEIAIDLDTQEDLEWREKIRPLLEPNVTANVLGICNHGFTEMLNNVMDHSESPTALVNVSRTAVNVKLMVKDFGIGIFQKIQQDFDLNDPRHALLELSKGKLTSDKTKHAGEGIFFTSRMFDHFSLRSGRLFFARTNTIGDWLIEADEDPEVLWDGTCVIMEIAMDSPRKISEIFDRYASEFDDHGFTKTHIPIKLGLYDDDQLVSRSAAKRFLARVNSFREVLLDFQGVASIGQAFADEIFRVFVNDHPEVHVMATNTNAEIDKMISRTTQNSAPASQMSLV